MIPMLMVFRSDELTFFNLFQVVHFLLFSYYPIVKFSNENIFGNFALL
jgi:hypothetical protein